ncbi:MAG: hypothetical protein GOVbin655_56 [Prokaryotic dsDNA virus sp.]|nr:MAG: hypothetical protein GOVbin655_56 [Prokaryotic dsDNA virus sp.]
MSLEEKLKKLEKELHNLRMDIENDRLLMRAKLEREFYEDIESGIISDKIDTVRGK